MDNEELELALVARIADDIAGLKGEMAAATIVICHLLHSATADAKTEARVALRLGAQRWIDQNAPRAFQVGFSEAMARYRA